MPADYDDFSSEQPSRAVRRLRDCAATIRPIQKEDVEDAATNALLVQAMRLINEAADRMEAAAE